MNSIEKLPCSIIEDLIPLCRENLCSEDSRALVEAHIADCESCMALYKSIETPQVAEPDDIGEKRTLVRLRTRVRRGRVKTLVSSVAATLVAVPLIVLTYGQITKPSGFVGFDTITQNVWAAELAQRFADGDIEGFLASTDFTPEKCSDLKALYEESFGDSERSVVEVVTRYDTQHKPLSRMMFRFIRKGDDGREIEDDLGISIWRRDSGLYDATCYIGHSNEHFIGYDALGNATYRVDIHEPERSLGKMADFWKRFNDIPENDEPRTGAVHYDVYMTPDGEAVSARPSEEYTDERAQGDLY